MTAKNQWKYLRRRLRALFRNPLFWFLTLGGQIIILTGAALLYWLESSSNGHLTFLDYILWSAGIVTTVGYGNLEAVTTVGKLAVLGLMLTGSVFIWSYMAFLVTGLMAPELGALEKDLHEVEKEIRDLKGSNT